MSVEDGERQRLTRYVPRFEQILEGVLPDEGLHFGDGPVSVTDRAEADQPVRQRERRNNAVQQDLVDRINETPREPGTSRGRPRSTSDP